jgi:hypothetical protein
MKSEKRMPDEPMLEGKPASAWGWFLAGVAWLMLVTVIVVPAAFAPDAARDAAIEATRTELGDTRYTLVVFVLMMCALWPFLFALDRAVIIKHRYRRERGMVTADEQTLYEKGNFFKTLALVMLPVLIGLMIYLQTAGGQ